eukprot:gnl/Dysnectes_brevis/2813_a3431_1307.p1 GENE.gnl/Dysnectes_brevis/2813_a3431_1307~~gnl/Dysnectes_brevis/2813_a3431_1307.p1  ORF type:complete len:367 (-),score=81.24 gnl/Dysnectes_brevis/2813_a3431_1307:84-1184(-)
MDVVSVSSFSMSSLVSDISSTSFELPPIPQDYPLDMFAYDEDRIGKPFTIPYPYIVEYIPTLFDNLKNQMLLSASELKCLFAKAFHKQLSRPNVQHITTEAGSKIAVVGDLHGQFFDFYYILLNNGFPPHSKYVFNGDFVDRGPYSLEIIIALAYLTIVCPDHVFLNRGNHEGELCTSDYGFLAEISSKYQGDTTCLRVIYKWFASLPIASVVNRQTFIVHAGLPSTLGITLEEIDRIDRMQEPADTTLGGLLWADPQEDSGFIMTHVRPFAPSFGPDVTAAFLEANGLRWLIRSHEAVPGGYHVTHHGKLVTVFSAPGYHGVKATYLLLANPAPDNPAEWEVVKIPICPRQPDERLWKGTPCTVF